MKRIVNSSSKSVNNEKSSSATAGTTSGTSGSNQSNVKAKQMIETRPASASGFKSFIKWFKKNDKSRQHSQRQSSSNGSNVHPKNDSWETRSSQSSLNLDCSSRSSRYSTSSCDSILSTDTTGFAFISPNNYRPYGDASQPKKLIDPGPITATYRNRLKKQDEVRENDRILELTLRRKYKLFHENEVKLNYLTAKNNLNTTYSEYSLPNPKHIDIGSSGSQNGDHPNKIKHRRTASDSSKDRKAGDYVHIKGKRKAPPPPGISIGRSVSQSDETTPIATSTLGRSKKRKAPQPPRVKSMIEDEQMMSSYLDHGKSPSDKKMETSETFKLENGMLKSTKEYKPITPSASPPISPRPWYKRASIVRENNFVIPKPIEKLRYKNNSKEYEFPEVGFSRNMSIDQWINEGVKFRTPQKNKENKQEKRKSGSRIPSISELDREAAEIVENDQVLEQAKIKKENDKYYRAPHTVVSEPNTPKIFDPKKDEPKGEEILVNKTIVGVWSCPYCTLENPNWRIVCEVCEKLKPYDLRFVVRPFTSAHNTPQKTIEDNTILKSSSETALKLNERESSLVDEEKPGLMNTKDVVITTTVTLVEPPTVVIVQNEKKDVEKSTPSPDLDVIRKARITHFQQNDVVPKADGLNTREKIEREKERLRKKIEEMNSKAIAEKYPTASAPPLIIGAVRKMCPKNVEDNSTRMGAIKKSPPKCEPQPNDDLGPIYENLKDVKFTPQETAKVEEMTNQLQSQAGLDEFRKTLKTSKNTMSNKNTLAINKILRNLEAAIADGDFETAATLAKNLAKMRVSLSVMRQQSNENPIEKLDVSDVEIEVDLFITEEGLTRDPVKTKIKPSMKLHELKAKILVDHNIPIVEQIWIFNDQTATDDNSTLMKYGITSDDDPLVLKILKVPDNDSDDNESIAEDNNNDDEEGAAAFIPPIIEEIAWTCPLCTLLNEPEDKDCGACSQPKPKLGEPKNDLNKQLTVNRQTSQLLNIKNGEDDVKLPLKIPLDTFSEPQPSNFIKRPTNTSIVMTVLNNPNITRTKYLVDPIKFTPFQPLLVPIPINPIIKPFVVKANYAKPKVADISGGDQPMKPKSPKKIKAPQPPSPKKEAKFNVNHYQELLKLDSTDVIVNLESFECPICFMKIESGDGMVLRECLHSFCKGCIFQTIVHDEEIEIKCPYMDNDYSCECILQDREIKALVTPDVYEKHLAKSLRVAENIIENAFHCKTPNCRGWCIYEDDVNEFKCPVCCITNCLTCQVIHDGLNCKQYQDRLTRGCDNNTEANRTKEMLKAMIDKGEAINCPICQIFLMKKWGCDWLKCSMCKTEICWVTRGPRWGPGGKGDTTGGCRCGVDGKKCHEKCNYCH